MAVYRFRVFIEDNHEIYRDIEILGRHDFADLHRAIVLHFNFQGGQPAEYVTSDSTWYEGEDVVSLDAELNGKPTRIVSHINDPHQRFLCVTMSFKQVGLALELLKIIKDQEEGISYPRMVKSHGDAPFYTQPPVKPIPGDVPDEDDEQEKKPRKKGAAAAVVDDEPTDDQIGEEDTDLLNDDTVSDPDAPAGDDDDDLGVGGDSDDDDEEEGEGDPGFSNFDMDEL